MKLYDVKVSKYLSYVLRHAPESIGLKLNVNGWASINELIEKATQPLTREQIEAAVAHNEKKRFAIDGDYIRANQGHSIDVDLALEEVVPPEFLFHGTAEQTVATILRDGLQKMSRQHVHLSLSHKTALQVGGRHGIPHILIVGAKAMHEAGHKFWISENGVYLTDEVPPGFIA